MLALLHLGIFSTFAFSVHSTPTNLDVLASRRKFSIQQVAVNKTTPSIFHEIRSTYWKYGWDTPYDIEDGVQAVERHIASGTELPPGGNSGSVIAKSIHGDMEYLINVQVGQHDLMLDLDTGSSDLWVMSTLLQPAQRNNKPANRLYNPANARPMEGSSWTIRYGDMSTASGKVFVDRVSIGTLEVSNQAVEAATNMSSSFTKGGSMDGLMGLGASRLNRIKPQAQPTWFDNIRQRLAQPVFVSMLRRHAAGQFDFGFLDRTKYKGEINWQTVRDPRGFWDFQVEGFAVGNGPVQQVNVTAIADTGSSLWYAPAAMTEGFWKNVPGAQYNAARGGYTIPCNTQIPSIRVILAGGKSVTVPGQNLNYQTLGNICFGGLQRNTGMPMSIFGDTFLKGLYVAFEHKMGSSPRIGLANGNF